MERRTFETGDVPDALLVLNAGSSSLKFSVYLDEEPLRLLLRGGFEELSTRPRFVAHADGTVIGERDWAPGTQLGYTGATDFLFAWGREGVLGGHRVAGDEPQRHVAAPDPGLDVVGLVDRAAAADLERGLLERHGDRL